MHRTARILALCVALAAGHPAIGCPQAPCNTWQLLPPVPLVYPYPAVGLAYDPLSQELYQAANEGGIGPYVVPWVGRRVGNTWVTLLDPSTFMSGEVRGIEVLDVGNGPTLYAFGTFGLRHWNGTTMVPDPQPPPFPLTVTVFDDGSGKALYVGGDEGVFRLVGGTWVSIGALFPTFSTSLVQTLVVHDDGLGPALYAGGLFSSIGGVPAVSLARWNGVAWSALGSGIAGLTPSSIFAYVSKLLSVREENGSRLYAGGAFLTMDGQAANCLARFDGTSWTGLGIGTQPLRDVTALASFDDGTGRGASVFAMGEFPVSSPPPTSAATFLKRIDAGVWSDAIPPGSSLGPSYGPALLVADLPETVGADIVAPVYGAIGPETARFEACGETGRIYCVGDGAGVACPCGNNSPTAAQAGCVHSLGSGGALRAGGRASLAQDTLHLDGSSMHDGPVVYYQGTQPNQIPFGDGFICATGSIVRLRLLFNQTGASTDPEPGAPNLSTQGFLTSPGTRYYSERYRDGNLSYCTAGTFNYTNGVAVVWSP